jgi:GDP/UDP-N,N'-diacetylbacillosamine 2-epimerase (hydrolysing)
VAGVQMASVLQAVQHQGLQALCLMPNADAGNTQIREVIQAACASDTRIRAVTHLARQEYVSVMATADVLVGNSSSGIVEAASFGTPVVNVGDRQAGRERNRNTVDCTAEPAAIAEAIRQARKHPRDDRFNLYGDGRTDKRIAELVAGLDIGTALLKKTMTY